MDGLEDLFGGLGPHEGFGVGVPVGDPGADVAFEVVHAAVVAAFEELAGEFGEQRSTWLIQLNRVLCVQWMRKVVSHQVCTVGALWVP